MQIIVDPSADGVWNAVETIQTPDGDVVHEPKSPDDWSQVRRAALTLVEGANLLMLEDRRVGARYFAAEAAGALDSNQIGDRVHARKSTFNGFAVALREAAQTALIATDDKDAAALLKAGGALDQVCEGCHLTFWYPNQVIPRFPKDQDAAHPILRLGALTRNIPESIN